MAETAQRARPTRLRQSFVQPSGWDARWVTGGANAAKSVTTNIFASGKQAWTQGCEARWHGSNRESVPQKKGPAHDAWVAGWLWADTQPDRRDASRLTSRAHGRRRSTDREEPQGDGFS